MNGNNLTYQEAVKWLRSQPEYFDLIKLCYLDENNNLAANNFVKSEEFVEVVKILKLNQLQIKFKILDIGCGNGIASYAFASLGHQVFAVDPDPSEDVGLEATKRLSSMVSKGSIIPVRAFAESLPFSDSTFDIVYARQALHHFSNLQKGLAECSKVLKPKGILFATREHVVSDREQLKTFLDNHILHQLHGGENAYPLRDYQWTLEQSGFKIIKCFAPFDTVINHFPKSNAQIQGMLFQKLERKLGKVATSVLIHYLPIEKIYRYHLSLSCNLPGRLYSFLCIKKK